MDIPNFGSGKLSNRSLIISSDDKKEDTIDYGMISTDEGSFATRIFVVIRLLLVIDKYQRGQILHENLHSFVKNEAGN